MVSRLSIDRAEFWVSDGSPEHGDFSPATINGGTVRMILTVADPERYSRSARAAGAAEVYRVSERHGRRIGRVVDPYGHHWEVGRQLPP